jgi:hypothetical protein
MAWEESMTPKKQTGSSSNDKTIIASTQELKRSEQKGVRKVLVPLRWWYESSQYTDDVVYCWMDTRFWLLSSRWSICRDVSHVTSHCSYLIRLSSIYLIDKTFRSYTDITRKWWNRLSCLLIHSFHSRCRPQIDDICVNQLRKSLTRINLRHCIGRICIFINSPNLRNLSSLIWLTKTHQVDHQSFFWRDFELDETVIKWSWISQ